MRLEVFTGHSSREAFLQARTALGPDLVVLANQVVDGFFVVHAVGYPELVAAATPVNTAGVDFQSKLVACFEQMSA